MNLKLLFLALAFCTTFVSSAQWEVKHVIEVNETLLAIKFFADTTGFATGEDGLLLKSMDAGEHWERLENDMIGTIADFAFISADTLLAVSNYFENGTFEQRIYKSTDGGWSWTEKYLKEGDFGCIEFMNSQVGIASGYNKIIKTDDGGETWKTVHDLTLNNFRYGSVRKFSMVNDSVGYAVGTGIKGVFLYSFVLQTIDGGDSWQEIHQFEDWLQEVRFINEEEGYISDSRYTYKTIDGGLSWDTLSNVHGVVGISIPTPDKVITVNRPAAYTPGPGSTVFAISSSTDAGHTWDGEYSRGAHLEAVHFITDSIGYIVGDFGIIMKTESCGGEITGNYPWHLFITSTQELELTELKLYPNPVTDKLVLQGIEQQEDWNYRIEMINGITIKQGVIHDSVIDVSQIPAGIYSIVLVNKRHRKVGRFVKL